MSDESFYSNDWHRVSDLIPRLSRNAGIQRQEFRGELWYVLQDRSSGRFHRFSPEAWLVISLFDGKRTVSEIWDIACARLGDDVLTQGEVISLLAQLHQADVLQCDVLPNVAEMLDRAAKKNRKKMLLSFVNPLALRVPLIDPDAFLDATMPLARPFLGWFGALVFLGVVGYAGVLLGIHWERLTENVADRVLSADSLFLLLLTYPFVKALHELGHGYTVKRWGGEVHEIGTMFLVFMPVPYVDASAASGFRSKYQRAMVGAAGIFVEIFLASVAMIIWVDAEQGLLRAFAFNVMLIGGVSTLLFNGNPLLRFDGYYVLSDLIEIPNLGPRSNRYIGYLIKRYAFGVERAETPVSAPGEAKWLFFYAIAAFIYRTFVVAVIVLFVATLLPLLGVLIAIWSVVLLFAVPLAKQIWFLLTSPVLRQRRGRAFAVTGGSVAALLGLLMFVRLPHFTVVEGVVWTEREAAVYASGAGHVTDLRIPPNSVVEEGTALSELEDPVLQARVNTLRARVIELSYRVDAVPFDEPARLRVMKERLRKARRDFEHAERNLAELGIRSPAAGRFVVPEHGDLPGRFFNKGELIGYVVDFARPVLIAVVPEMDADLVRTGTKAVDFRLAEAMEEVWPARVRREVPKITDELPNAALASAGGGSLSLDPEAANDTTSLTKVLQLELTFDAPARVQTYGGRVYVRFRHDDASIAARVWRGLRQLFLKEFSV